MWLSYDDDSNNWVYFDDLKVTHTKNNLIQYNEYYPFGMQTATSWTRENNTGNNFLANGGTELNSTSSLYDLQYRNYDPILGRMNQVDPKAAKYGSQTPYNFAFNDPVYWNDPMGADPSPGEPDFVVRPSRGEAKWSNSDFGIGLFSRTAPGSGNHWSDGFNSLYFNLMMMPRGTFESFYGVDLNTNEGRAEIAERIGSRINLHFANDGSDESLYIPTQGAKQTAWFINGELRGIYSNKKAYFYGQRPDDGVVKWFLVFKDFSDEKFDYNDDQQRINLTWITGGVLTFEDVYNNFIHDHKYYKTTNNARRGIYKKPGVFRSPQAAKYALRSTIVEWAGVAGTVLMTASALDNISMGKGTIVDISDASVGTIGLIGTASSYYGYAIPGVGQGVALYAWARMWWDLGAEYGPSKWFK